MVPLHRYRTRRATADAGAWWKLYVSDHLRLGRYVTLLGGERFTTSSAAISTSPRSIRASAQPLTIPRLHWVLRGFYGHFFQPAPLETVSSSVLNYASQLPSKAKTRFTPVPSERDEEHQFGIQIPFKGWLLDVANVKNRINNFLDHSNIGRVEYVLPDRRGWSTGAFVADDAALSDDCAARANSTSPTPTRSPSSAEPSPADSPAACPETMPALRRIRV